MIPYMRQCTIGLTLAHRLAVALAILCSVALATAQTGGERTSWARVLDQPEAWYGSPEARRIAEIVLRYQRGTGGWPKDIDMTAEPDPARLAPGGRPDSTIDNGATTTQVRLLARVAHATGNSAYRSAAQRGIDYLLAAQYANGGWPQFFPLRNDYSRYITYNDNAMVNVMRLLDDVAKGEGAWAFTTSAIRSQARTAVDKGVAIVLRSQVRVDGRLTAWCAQHDEVTLEPRPARTYEHASLSGMETVGIVRFLMDRATPADARIAPAVHAAVAWLESVKITGLRLAQQPAPGTPRGWDRVLVPDPSAPPLWARFYDIRTNRPIFSGRDGIIRTRLDEIEYERRTGYAWVGEWPRDLLGRDYLRWRGNR